MQTEGPALNSREAAQLILANPDLPVYMLGGYDHGYDDDYALEVVGACIGTVYMVDSATISTRMQQMKT